MKDRKMPASPRRNVAHAAVLLSLAPIVGCSSSGTTATDGDRTPTPAPRLGAMSAADAIERVNRQTAPFSSLGWTLDWAAPVNVGTDVEALIPAGDVVFVQDDQNEFTVRETSTGAFRWSAPLDNPLVDFLGHVRADDARITLIGREPRRTDVVLNCSVTEVFVRDLNSGELMSRQRLLHLCATEPVLFGNELILGGLNGNLLFHDFTTNLYTHRFGLPSGINVAPALTGNQQLGVVARDGSVAVLDAHTADARGRSYKLFAGSAHPPATDQRSVYIASLDQSLYAFDTVTGERRWRLRTDRPLSEAPTAHGGRVYVALPETGLLAVDGRRGDIIWTAETLDRGSVIGTKSDELLFWDGKTLSVVDTRTGDIIESQDMPFVRHLVTDGFEDPALYAVTDADRLLRFRIP